MITICLTHFRGLTLANFAAALYSVRRQDFLGVERIVIVDNNSAERREDLQATVDALQFPIPVKLTSYKHGRKELTHAWSTNEAVSQAETPWIFFTRSDYLLDFSALSKFRFVVESQPEDWKGFITSNGRHVHCDVIAAEQVCWRERGAHDLPGVDFTYTCIDAGVWMAQRSVFAKVRGMNERLSVWGHAQTHFQYKLHAEGTECVRINETLFFHPAHHGERNIEAAHRQLADEGISVQELWSRYDGAKPY